MSNTAGRTAMYVEKSWEEWAGESSEAGQGDLESLGNSLQLICWVNGVRKVLSLKDAYEVYCSASYSYVREIDEFSMRGRSFSRRYVVRDVANEVGRRFLLAIMRRRFYMNREHYQDGKPDELLTEDMFVSHARWARKLMLDAPSREHLFHSDRDREKGRGDLFYRLNKRCCYLLIWGAAAGTSEDDVPYELFSGPIDEPPAARRETIAKLGNPRSSQYPSDRKRRCSRRRQAGACKGACAPRMSDLTQGTSDIAESGEEP